MIYGEMYIHIYSNVGIFTKVLFVTSNLFCWDLCFSVNLIISFKKKKFLLVCCKTKLPRYLLLYKLGFDVINLHYKADLCENFLHRMLIWKQGDILKLDVHVVWQSF